MQPEQLHDPRVALAAERTLLAWVRTSLAMMGFGFVVAKFGLFLREVAAVNGTPLTPGSGLSLWIGGRRVVRHGIGQVAHQSDGDCNAV